MDVIIKSGTVLEEAPFDPPATKPNGRQLNPINYAPIREEDLLRNLLPINKGTEVKKDWGLSTIKHFVKLCSLKYSNCYTPKMPYINDVYTGMGEMRDFSTMNLARMQTRLRLSKIPKIV